MAKPWEQTRPETSPITPAQQTSKPWEQDWDSFNTRPEEELGTSIKETFMGDEDDEVLAPPEEEIFKQPDDIFLGTEYSAEGFTDPANQELYEEQGEPLTVFGIPLGRKQVTDKGTTKQETYIVPPPVKDDATGSVVRTVGGGALELSRNVLAFGEYLLEKAGLDHSDEEYINQTFPRMPAASNTEKTIQEISSIVLGMAGGSVSASTLSKAFKLPEAASKFISTFWNKAKKIDPKHAQQKLEYVIRALVAERGANIGAAVGTPQDTRSLAETFGFIDPATDEGSQLIAHYLDNEGFSAGLRFLSMIGGGASNLIKKTLTGGFNQAKQIQVTKQVLKAIDPGITDDLTPEQLAQRLDIFGEILNKHSGMDTQILGRNIPKDAAMAFMSGAKEYVERVYGFMRVGMTPEEFAKEMDNRAAAMVNSLLTIKGGLRANPIVAASDAQFLEQTGRIFGEEAEKFAPADVANRVGQGFAGPVIRQVDESLGTVKQAESNVLQQQAALVETQDRNAVTTALMEARQQGALGSTASESAELSKLAEEELYSAWLKGKTTVDEAFTQIPNDTVDAMELATIIKRVGDESTALDDFGFSPSDRSIRRVGDPTEESNPIAELAQMLEERGRNDIHTIINNVRPRLSQRITAALESGDAEVANQAVVLRNSLDALIQKNTNPAIQRAYSEYKKFADTWLQTPPLQKFDAAARQVKDVGEGYVKGSKEMREAGLQALAASESALSDTYLTKFVEALKSGGAEGMDADLVHALVGKAIKALTLTVKPGERASSQQIIQAIQPYIKSIERIEGINSPTLQMFNQTVEAIQMAESGLGDVTKVLADAQLAHSRIVSEAERSAAGRMVFDLTGNPMTKEDTGKAFKAIFEDKDAPNVIKRLMDSANDMGDEMALNGVKSEFIRWLNDRILTPSQVSGVKAGGEGFVRDQSQSALYKILESPSDNTLATMKEIFADDTSYGTAVYDLMERMYNQLGSRSMKANPFGSQTADAQAVKRNINTMIVLALGVLNPLATKARSLSGALLAGQGQKQAQVIENIMAELVTNPKFLKDSLDMLKTDITGETLKGVINRIGSGTGVQLSRGLIGSSRPTTQTDEEGNPVKGTIVGNSVWDGTKWVKKSNKGFME